MEASSEQDVTLVIKNPTRTDYGFQITMKLASSVLDVQRTIQDKYEGKPDPSCQTLIYAGKVLKDTSLKLSDILKQPIDLATPQSLHLVIKSSPNGAASSSTSASAPSSSTLAPIPTAPAPAPQTFAAAVNDSPQADVPHQPAPAPQTTQQQPQPAPAASSAAAPAAAASTQARASASAGTSNAAASQAPAMPYIMVNPVVAAAYQAAYAAALATTAHLNHLQQASGAPPSTGPMMIPIHPAMGMLFPPGTPGTQQPQQQQAGMPAPWPGNPYMHAQALWHHMPMQQAAAAAEAAGGEAGLRARMARMNALGVRRGDVLAALPRPRRVQTITLRINMRLLLQMLVFAVVVYQHFTMQRLGVMLLVLLVLFVASLLPPVHRLVNFITSLNRPANNPAQPPAVPAPAAPAAGQQPAQPQPPPRQPPAAPARPGVLREIAVVLVGFFTSLLPTWNYNPDDAAAFQMAQELVAREQQLQQQNPGAAAGGGEGAGADAGAAAAAGGHEHQE